VVISPLQVNHPTECRGVTHLTDVHRASGCL
jgi:hypothetical protein